jgi:hypothetical protein
MFAFLQMIHPKSMQRGDGFCDLDVDCPQLIASSTQRIICIQLRHCALVCGGLSLGLVAVSATVHIVDSVPSFQFRAALVAISINLIQGAGICISLPQQGFSFNLQRIHNALCHNLLVAREKDSALATAALFIHTVFPKSRVAALPEKWSKTGCAASPFDGRKVERAEEPSATIAATDTYAQAAAANLKFKSPMNRMQ